MSRRRLPTGEAADPDVVRILCQEGRLEEAVGALDIMEQQGLMVPLEAYGLLLHECGRRKSLVETRLVQAHLARNGLDSNGYLGNQLVGAFVQCGSHSDALRVLESFPNRSVSSWTAVISGYANMGQDQDALDKQMVEAGLEPNTYTFLSALKACVSLLDLEQGRKIHAHLMKYSCASDAFVGTALLGMYAKCCFECPQNVVDTWWGHEMRSCSSSSSE